MRNDPTHVTRRQMLSVGAGSLVVLTVPAAAKEPQKTSATAWTSKDTEGWLAHIRANDAKPGTDEWNFFWSRVVAEGFEPNGGALKPVVAKAAEVLSALAKNAPGTEHRLLEEALQARSLVAAIWGITENELNREPGQIVITQNTTHGNQLVAESITLCPGQEVIVTDREHLTTRTAFEHAAARAGAKLVTAQIPITPDLAGAEIVESIEKRIVPGVTRLLSVPHVDYLYGVQFPIAALSELCRRHDVYLHVDGAHGLGMLPVKISELGCDSYAANVNKWIMGIEPTGFLWRSPRGREEIAHPFLAIPDSLYHQGTGSRSVIPLLAASEALRVHLALGSERVWERIQENARAIRAVSRSLPGLTPVDSVRGETTSGLVRALWTGRTAHDAAQAGKRLSEAGIRIRGIPDIGTPIIGMNATLNGSPDGYRGQLERLFQLWRK